MSATADLIIRIVADTSAAKKPLDDSASRVDKVGRSMGKLAVPAAAVVGAIALVGKAAVDSASRTQQAMGALDSVFGKNAGQVKKWAEGAATAVGLSKSQYGELASVIGAQLKNLGIPFDQIAGKTNNLVSMGADLAATFGGSTADAVSALSATLRGETDPIERYGVSIKQATIDAKMAADGTDKLTGAAGKQARTMATLSLITEQTADAHGQFARESDSAAGAAQIQAAQIENLKSSLGTALLPIVAKVAAALGKFAAFAEKNTTLVQILAGVVLVFASAILVLVGALKLYNLVTEIMAVVSKSAWLSALGPIGLVIVAVVAVIAIIVILWKKSETFRRIVLGVWSAVKGAASVAGRAISAAFRVAFAVMTGYVKVYLTIFRAIFIAIRAVVNVAGDVIRAIWRGVFSVLSSLVRGYVATFRAVFQGVRDAAGNVADAVRGAWERVFGALRSGANAVRGALVGPFNAVQSAVNGVIGAVQNLIGWLSRIKVPKISLPHIPGLSLSSASAAPSPAFGTFAAPRVGGTVVGGRVAGGGVSITINGALDPEGVARQIGRILDGHDRRVGRTAVG